MLVIVWNLTAVTDLLASRIYSLADDISYASWLVEWRPFLLSLLKIVYWIDNRICIAVEDPCQISDVIYSIWEYLSMRMCLTFGHCCILRSWTSFDTSLMLLHLTRKSGHESVWLVLPVWVSSSFILLYLHIFEYVRQMRGYMVDKLPHSKASGLFYWSNLSRPAKTVLQMVPRLCNTTHN